MSWGSTVPTTLTALVTMFGAASPVTLVFNGPTLTAEPWTEAVTVGSPDAQTPNAAEGVWQVEGMAPVPSREQYTVNCLLEVLSGADDQTVDRARLFTIFNLYGAALATDPTLGGTVLSARMGVFALREIPADVSSTQLQFGVLVDAYTTI
jgi:hypothetical protein